MTRRIALEERLKEHIHTFGPITVRDFQDILLYSDDGYYANSTVIGRKGDFITAPEISQVFGEIMALCFVDCWQRMGEPTDVTLIELGAGQGTLMADMMRIFARFPDFQKAVSIHIVEICSFLRQQQTHKLGAAVVHHASLETVPESDVTFVVANEFFDALPIEQWVMGSMQDAKSPRFITYHDGWQYVAHQPDEYIYETSALSLKIAHEIKRRLMHGCGMALIVDYGDVVNCDETRKGATLQAIYAHKKVSVFDHMGQADLSHHVDFAALQDVFSPLSAAITTQGEFLMAHGMAERIEYLAKKSPEHASDLRTSAARLTAPSAMGALFKVLCVKKGKT